MPVDITLIKTALRVLANNGGRENLTEEIVGIDVETIIRRPLAAHQVREALMECKSRGWASEDVDTFGFPTWSITDEGSRNLGRI